MWITEILAKWTNAGWTIRTEGNINRGSAEIVVLTKGMESRILAFDHDAGEVELFKWTKADACVPQ